MGLVGAASSLHMCSVQWRRRDYSIIIVLMQRSIGTTYITTAEQLWGPRILYVKPEIQPKIDFCPPAPPPLW
eukprot:COSAG01_NODE_31549_length_595_cov_3.772177_1_plen_71_part_10